MLRTEEVVRMIRALADLVEKGARSPIYCEAIPADEEGMWIFVGGFGDREAIKRANQRAGEELCQELKNQDQKPETKGSRKGPP